MALPDVEIRNLKEEELDEADRIARVAFGTFLGLPDPSQMFGTRDMIRNRFRDNPSAVFAAYVDGKLVGTNVVSRWGSFGFFGPLTIRPDMWDKGIAGKLLTPTIELFSKWGTTHEGLFTFPQSPKHVGLYHKFGFHARFLTPVMVKSVGSNGNQGKTSVYSALSNSERALVLESCKAVTETLYPGLDLTSEITSVFNKKLGDTVLLTSGSEVRGFAVCHCGPGTEGGSDNCYVKFGAVREGGRADFLVLLDAVESFALKNHIPNIEAGMNLARSGAYEEILKKGYRYEFMGVAMQRPNEPGFNRPDVFAIDDWR